MANQKIFFSYSRVDGAAFAVRLATDLKKKGFDVWIDQEDIRAGLEWDTEIEKALKSCDCLLLLATEKSVISNNVLNEVYYVLEQHKKVVPLIFVDSKIPFRLNRLQHIDFTKDYDAALAQLVNELEGNTPDIIYTPDEKAPPTVPDKPFFAKNYRALVIAAGLAVVVATAFLIAGKNKSGASANTRADTTSLDTATGNPDSMNAIAYGDRGLTDVEPKSELPKGHLHSANTKANTTSLNTATGNTATGNSNNMTTIAYGDWNLTNVEPKSKLHEGYLHIEASGEKGTIIRGYMQFYYPDTKADASLTVFNAFVGCASCALSKEMSLKVEDIAIGSHTIKRAQADQANGKKAGDIILDAWSNKSIRGTADLQFVDKSNAVIKVRRRQPVELTDELKLEPFEYTFHFKKDDY
jgi:hypothetical protein